MRRESVPKSRSSLLMETWAITKQKGTLSLILPIWGDKSQSLISAEKILRLGCGNARKEKERQRWIRRTADRTHLGLAGTERRWAVETDT